jgi:hypothetical protein
LAILVLSTSHRLASNATGMMIIKGVFGALLFVVAREAYQAVGGVFRKRTRIMASMIGILLLVLLIVQYGEMWRQAGALKNLPISFLLKIPDYGFLIIFPFTVGACLAVPFLLKKGAASKS